MTDSGYEYPVEECDVPQVRHGILEEYRSFRSSCLEYLHGDFDSSVTSQIHELAWQTAVFRTLNEARRLEPERPVNGALWDLASSGYSSILALGIRKLVDRDRRTDSLWNVVSKIERRLELLTRENYVCFDGIPFDYKEAQKRYYDSLGPSERERLRWVPTTGPQAWGMSELMHEAFDQLCGRPARRRRSDRVDAAILRRLKERLAHPAIVKVQELANRRMAHAERISPTTTAPPTATYNEVDTALEHLVRVMNFISSHLFYDVSFGSIVPVPQYDVLEALDQPWSMTDTLPELHQQWSKICETIDGWARGDGDGFIGGETPSAGGQDQDCSDRGA